MEEPSTPDPPPEPAPDPPPLEPAPADDPTQGLGLEYEWKGEPKGGETLDDVLSRPGIERRG